MHSIRRQTCRKPGFPIKKSAHMTFRANWEYGRPPGAAKKAEKALFNVALEYRNELWLRLGEIDAEVFDLEPDEVDELAVAVTGMAEDLHADAGLWRSLEAYHAEFFGVPLPLLCRDGDAGLETFDARRFRFFFYTLWRLFHPDHIVSPGHRGFIALAEHASGFFRKTFAGLSQTSPWTGFFAGSNRRGREVKRKLVWIGTRSFLFRLFHQDYVAHREPKPGEEIATTDDFLCQECTAWSGLGGLDILAATLDLSEDDRKALRGWHERHMAVYRIGKSTPDGRKEELLEAVNEINGQPYRVRIGTDMGPNPFRSGVLVFGSLVSWRGDWYWSGTQKILSLSSIELAEARTNFRRRGAIAYRYCPDLEMRAREIEAEHHADFIKFHGADLAVFPDEASAAAAENKRLRLPDAHETLMDAGDKTAVFYHPGEGVEMFTAYGTLLAGLEKRDGELTPDEIHAIQAFMEEDSISPAFVRRVIRETGSAAVEGLYGFPENSSGIGYLLRRFKGCYFRKRYPSLSLHE